MTMPDERTRAVLWAGGLLVLLNGDRRVPMEIRQAATQIARHFPTRSDVAGASRLKLLGEYGSLFAHPRDCPGWEDSCPGRPLTESTRLRWPSEDVDDGIESDPPFGEADFADDEEAWEQLTEAIDAAIRARDALGRRTKRLFEVCTAMHPELQRAIGETRGTDAEAWAWLAAPHFDGGTKSAAELILDGRVADVMDRLRASG